MSKTEALWRKQDQHEGDRLRLFTAIHHHLGDARVLYPGSFVDVAPSFVFDDVTYVDMDRRAAAFFTDAEGVDRIVAEHRPPGTRRFIHADYTEDLAVEDRSVDLLVSLYAGLVSDACTRYLRVGGHLLVNPSHGDAALASLDDRYSLAAVVLAAKGDYRLRTEGLDGYMIPKRPDALTREAILQNGRGVAYTKPAFAYLFERVS